MACCRIHRIPCCIIMDIVLWSPEFFQKIFITGTLILIILLGIFYMMIPTDFSTGHPCFWLSTIGLSIVLHLLISLIPYTKTTIHLILSRTMLLYLTAGCNLHFCTSGIFSTCSGYIGTGRTFQSWCKFDFLFQIVHFYNGIGSDHFIPFWNSW